MVVGIAEAIVELFTAGARAYKRKKEQDKLEAQLGKLKTTLSKYRVAYKQLRAGNEAQRAELDRLALQHQVLIDEYNELARRELLAHVRSDVRELPPNPY